MANVAAPTYPREYHAILLALREDGTPITINKHTPEAAEAYRLQFYNFLKWCKRQKNAHSVTHLAGRYNYVGLSVKGSSVSFILKTVARFAESEADTLAQLVAQGVEVDTLVVPPSANPKIFAKRNEREAQPLMPFETKGDAPASNPLPYQPDVAAPGDWRTPEDRANDLKNLLKMQAQADLEKENGVLLEAAPVQWFQGTKRALGDGPLDQGSPQRRLQLVMDSLAFERGEFNLTYPTQSKNAHEPITQAVRTQLTRAWSDYFIDHGLMGAIDISEGAIGWDFKLTAIGEELFTTVKFPARVRHFYLEEDKNNCRLALLEYLKGATQ